jgi:hypothetical protein
MSRPSCPAGSSSLAALADPKPFAPLFPAAPWAALRAFLAAVFAQPLDDEALATYQRHTGRPAPPATAAREAWCVVGQRGGKSRVATMVAVYLACFRDWRPCLAVGERTTIMTIAADRRQARVVLRYIIGLLEAVPILAAPVERRTAEAIHLANRVTIEVHTTSFRTTRGYTLAAAICDEVAY